MIKEIIQYPNEILRCQAETVDMAALKAGRYDQLAQDLIDSMEKHGGLGIAAPQIGVSLRVVVIDTRQGPLGLFNPQISVFSWRKKTDEEGCLSLPGIYGMVKRSVKITVNAFNRAGEKINFKAEGLFARVIQHEADHLAGVLFIDHAKKIHSREKHAK